MLIELERVLRSSRRMSRTRHTCVSIRSPWEGAITGGGWAEKGSGALYGSRHEAWQTLAGGLAQLTLKAIVPTPLWGPTVSGGIAQPHSECLLGLRAILPGKIGAGTGGSRYQVVLLDPMRRSANGECGPMKTHPSTPRQDPVQPPSPPRRSQASLDSGLIPGDRDVAQRRGGYGLPDS